MEEARYRVDGRVKTRERSGGSGMHMEDPAGWTGRRYHLGNNKGVFDAEVFAVYRALSVIDQRQE